MTILEIKTGNPSPEIAKAQIDNYKRMVDLTTDTNTKKIDFSDCKKCPIRKECRECEFKDLTCEELYEALKADGKLLEET